MRRLRIWASVMASLLLVALAVVIASSHSSRVPRRPAHVSSASLASLHFGKDGCFASTLAAQRKCLENRHLRHASRVRPADVTAATSTPVTAPTNAPVSTATEVNPGSSIAFESPTVGWRLDGVYAAPWLDGNLTAGPAGATLTWPAPAVSESTDGGSTWHVVATDPHGYWGLDFLNPTLGWLVGVTSVQRTSDGGQTWTSLPEPADGPLVRLSFESPTAGVGLTSAGQLVATADGGESWHDASLPVAATSVCFSTPQVGYASDIAGDVYKTEDGGTSWAESYQSPTASSYPAVWSELTCGTQSAWQGIRYMSPQTPGEGFLVAANTPGSTSWSPVVSRSQTGPPQGALAGQVGLATLEGLAADTDRATLAGFPPVGAGLATSTSSTQPPSGPTGAPALAATTESVPSLAAATSLNPLTTNMANYMRVLGVSVVGQQEWAYVLDAAIDGASPSYQTMVLASSDGGSSWRTLNTSAPQNQPQYP